jgi:hypothetical protein
MLSERFIRKTAESGGAMSDLISSCFTHFLEIASETLN